MTLDATTPEPSLDAARDIDENQSKKRRKPGVIALRIVILLMLLLAVNLTIGVVGALLERRIDVVNIPILTLALVAVVGLLARSEVGRKSGIAMLWISFFWNMIGLIYILVIALGVAAGTIREPDRGSIGLSIGFQLLHMAVGIWMLTVLHSNKTIALMETSTPPASDEQEDHARASEHA
ncbi:MAG: hypothetical protein ABL309_10830 [Phycisphaerales bacterium]